MPQEKEVENMPIWQNHERRITTLENTFAGYSYKMDAFDKRFELFETKLDDTSKVTEKRFSSFEEKLDKGNAKQEELFNKLIDHHLSTNKIKLNNFWKFLIALVNGGVFFILLLKKQLN